MTSPSTRLAHQAPFAAARMGIAVTYGVFATREAYDQVAVAHAALPSRTTSPARSCSSSPRTGSRS